MNKRDLADRFSNDVDVLLHEAGVTDPKPAAPEYDDMLDLARTLATTDFSHRSQIRRSLRRRLLSRIDPTPTTTAEIPGPIGLIKQLFTPGRVRSWQSPGHLFRNKVVMATLTGLLIVFGLAAFVARPELQVRQNVVDLLARILSYLPIDQGVAPHGLAPRWQFRGDGGISSDPVAANGLLYAGSNAGYLYALDPQTGQERWHFKMGGGINLSPTVAAGLLYAASDNGSLVGLDSQTGLEVWRFNSVDPFSSEPIVAGDTVYAGTDEGLLYALEARTGREQWRFEAGSAISPAPAATETTLYVASHDHHLYALERETGREKWRFEAGNWLSTPAVEVAGLVYVGSHDENLYVLDAGTGREIRRYSLLYNAVRTSATLAGGVIYFGSYDSYLHAVDAASGDELWRFKMGKQTRSSPTVVDGVVYIGSGDGYLYEVDARTGVELARYGTDSHIYTTPAVVGDTIYVVNGKGELSAVQKAPLPVAEKQPQTTLAVPIQNESPGFQFTPQAWYVAEGDGVIRFQGRMVDGAGNPVDGVSVQADNGSISILSAPGGPNRRQPRAEAGAWEIVVPDPEAGAGWWWLTAVRYECPAGEADFDSQCETFTRLSESIKVEVVYPDEIVINADWTCQWNCQNVGERK
jgi:outer membrane protein assembly factor BamB